jgi:pimeloyl-ACP methyl ester carboxylesterase
MMAREIVLLHGIGGASWGPVLPLLSGWRVLDWPLPGYAGSPPLPETTFPALAQALKDALEAAGFARPAILGHSIGGMVAQEFALAFPERVGRLALYATTPAFGGRDPAFAEAFLAARLGPLEGRSMEQAAPAMLAGMFAADADPEALALAVAAQAAVPEDAYRATLRCLTTFDRRADLPRIAAPTRLIAGERDQAAPVKTMQRMAEAIPEARLAVIPDAGHIAHLERPEAFRAALAEALA